MKHVRKKLFFVFLLTVVAAAVPQAFSQSSGTGHAFIYLVSLSDPARHAVRVRLRLDPEPEAIVRMPTWNALYQIRDFSQSVLWLKARNKAGEPVAVTALDKTTWAVPNAAEVEYELLVDMPGPFSAQFNQEHAFMNLAEILIYPEGRQHNWPCVISFDSVPAGWKIVTQLIPFSPDTSRLPNSYMAVTYDALVDSPVEIGKFEQSDFDFDAAKYRVIVHANPSDYDLKAITGMARKLAATEVEWMQDHPFGQYLFIYHFPRHPAGGGMEHAYSTAIDASAERVKANPLSLADVTAHEFFHLWNVKRIRPQSLEPVDYTKEQYTRALWFSEGVTSTVADFIRVRAGYLDEKSFLAELASDIRQLESRPARLTQSVEEASLDTWLEKYPAYEEPERSISYYNKGEIVGMLLDLQMREVSGGKKSLRDLFHWMNERYAKQGKFFPDTAGVRDAAEKVTGADFGDFFARYVAGAEPIPYDKFFATVGLHLERVATAAPDAGFRSVRHIGKPAVVTFVAPGSAADKAGLRTRDTILKVNGRVNEPLPETEIASMRVGDTVNLQVAGTGRQRNVKFKVGAQPSEDYMLVEREDATPAQRARRAAWVRGDSE